VATNRWGALRNESSDCIKGLHEQGIQSVSLAIEIDDVVAIMIGGVWLEIECGSFDIDSYEFVHDDNLLLGGGQSGICPAGYVAALKNAQQKICGPLTALQAVRTKT
jgi:hypothetical protein